MLEGVERREGFQERQLSNTDDTYGNQDLDVFQMKCEVFLIIIPAHCTRTHLRGDCVRVARGRIHGRLVSAVQVRGAQLLGVRTDREPNEGAQAVVRRASTAAHEPEKRVQHRHSQSACRSGLAGVSDGNADESRAQNGLQFGHRENRRVEHKRTVERADERYSDQSTLGRT